MANDVAIGFLLVAIFGWWALAAWLAVTVLLAIIAAK